MIRNLLYLIIYGLLVICMLSCERIDIPGDEITVSDVQDEESPDKGEGDENVSGDDQENDSTDNVEIISDGTFESPYSVAESRTLQQAEDVWVKGYIVGYIPKNAISSACFSAESATNTNLLLADSMQEIHVKNCIPVELVSGSVRRRELNLRDNPLNLGRQVLLKGKLTTYFKVVGLKSTSAYQWISDQPEEEEEQYFSVISLSEDFSEYEPGNSVSLTGWSIEGSNSCRWLIGNIRTEKYAEICCNEMTVGHNFECWLITPPLNFDRMENRMMSFDSSYSDWDSNSSLDVFVMDKKNPTENNMLYMLNVPVAQKNLVAEGCWLHSGEVSLHSYSGIKYIGFRYKGKMADEKIATTFCLDNIKLGDLNK